MGSSALTLVGLPASHCFDFVDGEFFDLHVHGVELLAVEHVLVQVVIGSDLAAE